MDTKTKFSQKQATSVLFFIYYHFTNFEITFSSLVLSKWPSSCSVSNRFCILPEVFSYIFQTLLYGFGKKILRKKHTHTHTDTHRDIHTLVNSRIIDEQILSHVCMIIFLTFTWEFPWEYSVRSSLHWKSQKSVSYCLVITLWKFVYCLIWALNKSIIFGSNPLKLSVMYDMN